jgi:hypothetical protein
MRGNRSCRSTAGGSPPPPLPDPSGIYEGTVRLTIDNATPVTQPWRVVLKTRSCPDCAPGQYWLTGTSFDGVSYPGGIEERGSVDAVIDADGSALDFRLTTINCVFVNTAVVAPPQTVLRGGSFGTQPGPTLTVRGGAIDGTISGTDCLGRRIVGSVSLTRTAQNPGSSCAVSPGGTSSLSTTPAAGRCSDPSTSPRRTAISRRASRAWS